MYDCYCNRCGQDFNFTGRALTFFRRGRTIDLCPSCAKRFNEFMGEEDGQEDCQEGKVVWVAPIQTFPTSHMRVWLTEERAIEAVREYLAMLGAGNDEYDPHDWILKTRIGE